jgi:tripartite ATP-independent transporter DctP family solute receptor
MRTIGRLVLSGILAVVAAGASSFGAAAQSRQFTFAYDQPKGSGYDAGADIFDKKLKELSNGALSINKYPGAQLGTEAQTMQKVQTGDIDFVFLSTANASTAQPESGVFSIHFIFRDESHAIKVLGDPKVIAAMHDLYAAKITGGHMLGLGSQGLRHMYGKKPVQNVGDLKGIKMRVQATVTEDNTFPAYGAQVVHMPFGEVYTALQTGVVDMAENGINNYLINKHYEPAPVLSLTEHELTTPHYSSATRLGRASPTSRRSGCRQQPTRSAETSRTSPSILNTRRWQSWKRWASRSSKTSTRAASCRSASLSKTSSRRIWGHTRQRCSGWCAK